MTGDRGNDRDNQKMAGLGCLGRNSFITTFDKWKEQRLLCALAIAHWEAIVWWSLK